MFLIVGGGLAGITAARTLRSLDGSAEVMVLEAEPSPYYLRPGLIEVLAGRKTLPEITPFPRVWYEHRRIAYRSGAAVVALRPGEHEVELASGEVVPYDRLLLTCGAEAAKPQLPGADLRGVFTLRSAADAERIRTWAAGRRAAAVVGGGWLGIEVARALADLGLVVTVLERGPWLLHRQLDAGAGETLHRALASQGVTVQPDAHVVALMGDGNVRSVQLASGDEVAAGLVVLCAGILPRSGLASSAGLATAQGVVVDDHLTTSDPDVLAAGDVAEWRGTVYGIIPAAREQGEIAARNMVQPRSVAYGGTPPMNKLKVAGIDLVCLGNTQPRGGNLRELREAKPSAGRYVKFVLGPEGELAGAILLGAPDLVGPAEELAAAGVPAEEDLLDLLAS